MTVENTAAAVFTYERPLQVERCVSSIERNLPGVRISIYDDGSESDAARAALQRLGREHEVASSHTDERSSLGGLHANMNAALDSAIARGIDFLYLLQDDQRVVRRADAVWNRHVHACFSADADVGEVVILFPNGWVGDRYYSEEFAVHPSELFYENRHPFGSEREPSPELWGMFDTGVVYVPRLAHRGFRFEPTEWASARRARSVGLRAVWSRDPLAAFVPWPATHRRSRGRTRSRSAHAAVRVLARLNEWGVRAGRVDLDDMTPEVVDRLLQRSISQVPIAEHFLSTDRPCRTPWFQSRCFDPRKYHGRHLLRLAWLFDGSLDYMTARDRYWTSTSRRVQLSAPNDESSEVRP